MLKALKLLSIAAMAVAFALPTTSAAKPTVPVIEMDICPQVPVGANPGCMEWSLQWVQDSAFPYSVLAFPFVLKRTLGPDLVVEFNAIGKLQASDPGREIVQVQYYGETTRGAQSGDAQAPVASQGVIDMKVGQASTLELDSVTVYLRRIK